jgi:hypothetical protein
MDEHGTISSDAIKDEFGSWNEGLRTAGLEPVHRRSIPTEEVLDEISTVAANLGRAPSQAEMRDRGQLSVDIASDRFGSWTAAVRAAGYDPYDDSTRAAPRYTDEMVVEAIRAFTLELGHPPSASEMRKEGPVSPTTIENHFGSYNEGIRAAELVPAHRDMPAKRPDKEILSVIRMLADCLGRPPTLREMDAQGVCSASLVERRFGSWNQGLIEAGFEPHLRRDIPEDELLADLERLKADLGHPPRCMEYHRRGEFAVQTFQDRFGDWDAALEAAGYEPPGPRTGPEHHGWKGPEVWVQGRRYYGPNWAAQREQALERDDYVCQTPGCVVTDDQHRDEYDCGLHVHHIQPLRTFFEDETIDYEAANALDNLVSVCIPHHERWEEAAPEMPEFE